MISAKPMGRNYRTWPALLQLLAAMCLLWAAASAGDPSAPEKTDTPAKAEKKEKVKDVRPIEHNCKFTVVKPQETPFKPGEELVYRYSWAGVTAATTTVRFSETEHQAQKAWRFETTTQTARRINFLWSMNEHSYTLFSFTKFVPLMCYEFSKEDDKVTRRNTYFDFETNTARDVRRRLSPEPKLNLADVHFENGLDPLSVFYMLRCLTFEKGGSACFEVVTDANVYAFELKVLGFEKVTVPAGTYDTVKLKCEIKRLTGDKKKRKEQKYREITLWISTADEKLPVKLESSVFVGNVLVELTKYNKGE